MVKNRIKEIIEALKCLSLSEQKDVWLYIKTILKIEKKPKRASK